MERTKASANFYQDEFVYPGGDFSKIDPKLITIAQWLREQIGLPIVINSYATGGQYKESGLRDINTTTGAKKSAHKEGKAIDIKVQGWTVTMVYDWMMKRQTELFALGVREIENIKHTPTWVHIGTRGNWSEIKIINP